MTEAWRIVKAKHSKGAFTGEASSLLGGRWNSPGTKLIYTASSISLALLEMLVHLGRSETLEAYQLIRIAFEESHLVRLDRSSLPPTWRSYPPPREVQNIGDQWVAANTSVILAVPSAVVPSEVNYLVNPSHPDFRSLRISEPMPFPIDRRLATAG
jgi:RES domain-containing protein